MPLLSNNSIFDIQDINEVLESDPGLSSHLQAQNQKSKRAQENSLADIKKVLNRNQGSIEDASSVITEVMHNSQYDNTRLKAAEIVLDLHEVRNKDGNINKQPIINFNIVSDDVKISNIFAPHIARNRDKNNSNLIED